TYIVLPMSSCPSSTTIIVPSSIFFFQAEDGIRSRNVTGVQTCALPISVHGGGTLRSQHCRDQAQHHKQPVMAFQHQPGIGFPLFSFHHTSLFFIYCILYCGNLFGLPPINRIIIAQRPFPCPYFPVFPRSSAVLFLNLK